MTSIFKHLRLLRTANLKVKVGLGILLFLIVLSVIEPVVNNIRLEGHRPMEVGIFERWLRSSFEHPLGTDQYGRDLFALVLLGLRYTLIIGFLSGLIATLIAVSIALFSGYMGGKWDTVLRSITDGFLVIPTWPILATLSAYITKVDIIAMSAILGIFGWPFAARTIRAQILSLKERMFVDFAKISGLSDVEIIFKEIMPNIFPYIIVGFANAVMAAIFAETGLRVIGLGPSDIPTLGMVLNWVLGGGYIILERYLEVLVPVLILILIFVSFNVINIGLDETFNPRLKKITGL